MGHGIREDDAVCGGDLWSPTAVTDRRYSLLLACAFRPVRRIAGRGFKCGKNAKKWH